MTKGEAAIGAHVMTDVVRAALFGTALSALAATTPDTDVSTNNLRNVLSTIVGCSAFGCCLLADQAGEPQGPCRQE